MAQMTVSVAVMLSVLFSAIVVTHASPAAFTAYIFVAGILGSMWSRAVAVSIVCAVCCARHCQRYAGGLRSSNATTSMISKLLLVIAHPDDECMFFAPTIEQLIGKEGCDVSVVCLSVGNADGLGAIREKELFASCSSLGINQSKVTVVNDEKLQDGPTEVWDTARVIHYVKSVLEKTESQAIITFDGHGVSGHPNHIACFEAVRMLAPEIPSFSLTTVSLLEKYVGPLASGLDDVCSTIKTVFGGEGSTKKEVYTFTSLIPTSSWHGMVAHRSQFVWFRRLFVIFSRYGYVNELVRI